MTHLAAVSRSVDSSRRRNRPSISLRSPAAERRSAPHSRRREETDRVAPGRTASSRRRLPAWICHRAVRGPRHFVLPESLGSRAGFRNHLPGGFDSPSVIVLKLRAILRSPATASSRSACSRNLFLGSASAPLTIGRASQTLRDFFRATGADAIHRRYH